MDEKTINKISDISETLLVPLYSRALESKSEKPIIYDKKAIEITIELNKIFEKSNSELFQNLAEGRLRKRNSKKLNVAMALRTRKFDRYCISFLKENPNGIIVELGCGLSTRFTRVDNNKCTWYDLDFPELIDVRKEFFKESFRYHLISSSVTDFEWIKKIKEDDKKNLFVAEGLLMYLQPNEGKDLILNLQKSFPGCYLACEVVSTFIVKMLRRKIWRNKMQKKRIGKIIGISVITILLLSTFSVLGINVKNNETLGSEPSYPVSDYGGQLRVYVVEPVSRWDDYDGNPYHYGFLDLAMDERLSIECNDSYNKQVTWDAQQIGYDNVEEQNIMVIAAIFNPKGKISFPPFSFPFIAHYVDAAAAATPGTTGEI